MQCIENRWLISFSHYRVHYLPYRNKSVYIAHNKSIKLQSTPKGIWSKSSLLMQTRRCPSFHVSAQTQWRSYSSLVTRFTFFFIPFLFPPEYYFFFCSLLFVLLLWNDAIKRIQITALFCIDTTREEFCDPPSSSSSSSSSFLIQCTRAVECKAIPPRRRREHLLPRFALLLSDQLYRSLLLRGAELSCCCCIWCMRLLLWVAYYVQYIHTAMWRGLTVIIVRYITLTSI